MIVIGAGVVASFRIVPFVIILAGLLVLLAWHLDGAARRKASRDR